MILLSNAAQALIYAAKAVMPALEYANSHGCDCDAEMKDLQDAIADIENSVVD